MLTGSAPRLPGRIYGPAPTDRGLAAPMQVAGVRSGPRDLQALARDLAGRPLTDIAAKRVTGPHMSEPGTRRWELIKRTELFEAWVIGWPPGGNIDLHDHGESEGAVVTVVGSLMETSVGRGLPGRVATTTRFIPSGASLYFGPGHVHGIVNAGATTAVSVHVYAPRLTRMTRFRLVEGALKAQETARCDLGEAIF